MLMRWLYSLGAKSYYAFMSDKGVIQSKIIKVTW